MRDSARGCLLALVLEGAAILAGVLWGICALLDFPRLGLAAAIAFFAFTVAAVAVALLLVILGNTPAQRRLRRESVQDNSVAKRETAE